jgi:hypothetical protein
MKFDEISIRKLFGTEAAEDEYPAQLKSYYFKTSVYNNIHNDLPLRIIVGHKGVGKSAAMQVSYLENLDKNQIAIWLRPDDIVSIGNDETPILQRIRDWKEGLLEIICHKVLENVNAKIVDSKDSFNRIPNTVKDATGKLLSYISDILQNKYGQYVNLSNAKKDVIKKYLNNNKIYVYVDDLDRGWDSTQIGIQRISALINAVRDMTTENQGLFVRISLRSDVYFLVRTSDESTDKIESNVIWYTWNQHQLLVMLAKRIQTFLNVNVNEKQLLSKPQFEIAKLYDPVFEADFNGRGKWSHVSTYKVLASMIRRRPRDLVKLCTLAARTANENNHNKIATDDWIDNFDYYSLERIQDTINEYRSELPSIERLIMGMKPSNRERHKINEEAFLYDTAGLLKKIEIIVGNNPFVFVNNKTATAEQLAGFLYKINFVNARKTVEGSARIDRKYFEDHKYLVNDFVDFGYKWEVHPAFRWALYPDAGDEIYNGLSIDNEM